MKIILVPVIMGCALIGSVGLIKLIGRLFPDARDIAGKTQEWLDDHK